MPALLLCWNLVLGAVALLLAAFFAALLAPASLFLSLPEPVRALLYFVEPRYEWLLYAGVALTGGRWLLRRRTERTAVTRRAHRPLDLSVVDREQPDAPARVGALLQEEARRATTDVIGLVDDIILAAAFLGASDIHFEPKAEALRISFRIDGILRDVAAVPKAREGYVLNRLKVMSNLDISRPDAALDGRVDEPVGGRRMNLRMSVFPTVAGAKAVLRLLDVDNRVVRLEQFGFADDDLADFRRLIHAPQGLLLFTGPTGSGKTTLMYASLREILEKEEHRRNVVTLEDPIERVIPDVNQSQVDVRRGLTFAAGLRTLLRQDPNVILVGEIRDDETAKIALQAGQTGHLIMTTVHANSAAAAFGRLIEMGIEPFLLVSAITGVVGQRLVRRLCPQCRVERAPLPELLEQLDVRPAPGARYFDAPGCDYCGRTGFAGRIAVIELLRMNDEISRLVLSRGASVDIAAAMHQAGVRTLIEDGLRRVHAGDTSLMELLRVVR